MATHQIELFGHVTYSPNLSYQDVLDREEKLKLEAQVLLSGVDADFIHFEAVGDALRFQCVFTDGGESLFHQICDGLCPMMDNGLAGRLLFVDKDLYTLHYYSLGKGTWQEGTLALPLAGYLEKTTPVRVGSFPHVGPERRK